MNPLRLGKTLQATGRSVPAIYISEWKKAENRGSMSAPHPVGCGTGARSKDQAGRICWRLGCCLRPPWRTQCIRNRGNWVRSRPEMDRPLIFPTTITWAEGSSISYGLEGGTGPGYLAYLKVSGQSCLYNIWSKRGKVHLEHLISSLRQVKVRSR